MGQAFFYHLVERPLEATLPVLVEKALGAGWRVAILSRDIDLLQHMDSALWAGDGFLPHACAGGKFDADQRVLLTTYAPSNKPDCLMTIDGAEISAEDVRAHQRVCVLFSGADSAQMELARDQWRRLTGEGIAAQYWSDEGGKWAKKAESPSASA